MSIHHNINMQVASPVNDVPLTALENAALATLNHQRVTEPCELVLVLADDATLQDLNLRFRGINHPTDVLSFTNDDAVPFSVPVDASRYLGGRYLGDIVISVARAQSQAATVSAALSDELQLLVVHGVLHLLGYDHATADEKAQMWAAQDAILRHLDVAIPLPE